MPNTHSLIARLLAAVEDLSIPASDFEEEEADCPYVLPGVGHVDGDSLHSCGFNHDRYEVLRDYDSDSESMMLVRCKFCGEHVENG